MYNFLDEEEVKYNISPYSAKELIESIDHPFFTFECEVDNISKSFIVTIKGKGCDIVCMSSTPLSNLESIDQYAEVLMNEVLDLSCDILIDAINRIEVD